MTTKACISYWLDQMVEDHSIRRYEVQSCMPGLRWNLEISGFGGRSFTTAQAREFILGWRVAKIR